MKQSKSDIRALLKWLLKRPFFLKKEWRMAWEKFIYQEQSRFLLHKWHGRKTPFESTRYYNFLGRILFASKEVLAVFSREKLAKKSILLENFDAIDMPRLYQKGSDVILWPKSPFVALEKGHVSSEFIKHISNSLQLSYQEDIAIADKTETWESVCREFREAILDGDGEIIEERLVDFRKGGHFEKIITDQFEYVDTRSSYLREYLKAVDVVLEYHRHGKMVKKEILASMSESYAGNNHCLVYRGKRLSEKTLFYSVVLNDIMIHTDFDPSKRKVICDIGAGYGGLSRTLYPYLGDACHILVDLPEVLVFAAYYIKYNFPDAKVALLEDIFSQKGDFESLLKAYDFIIMPPWMLSYLPKGSVDLISNTASLGFLSQAYLDWYLKEISRLLKKGGYLYSVNQKEVSDLGVGMYGWKFEEAYLTLHLSFSNRFAYPQWLGKKL